MTPLTKYKACAWLSKHLENELVMATVEGGYDYDFVEPPPEGLLCKICQLPCREAQSSEGHVYCKHCISKTKLSAFVSYSSMHVVMKCFYSMEYIGGP